MHEPPPNGSRLSCGALKKDSFLNLRAPAASKRWLGSTSATNPHSANAPTLVSRRPHIPVLFNAAVEGVGSGVGGGKNHFSSAKPVRERQADRVSE